MGLHVPNSRLLTWTAASDISGPVGMISQSGGNAQDFVNSAADRFGLHFSKVISYGNALTMDSTDYLAYLAQDEETRIIAMYLEGVRDGRKLLRMVTEINRTKPIVMIKGGLSESGARTVASHTGSLGRRRKDLARIFQTDRRRAGRLPRRDGRGRHGPASSAACSRPWRRHFGHRRRRGRGGGRQLRQGRPGHAGVCRRTLMARLREFIPPAGNMIRNPIDAHIVLMNLESARADLAIARGPILSEHVCHFPAPGLDLRP